MGNKQQRGKQGEVRSKSAEPLKNSVRNNSALYNVRVIPAAENLGLQSQRKEGQSKSGKASLNQSLLNRSALTPPPRMNQLQESGSNRLKSKMVVSKLLPNNAMNISQRTDLNKSQMSNAIVERANISHSQVSQVQEQKRMHKYQIASRIEERRSASPIKLLPPKEEVSVILSSIRKKEIKRRKDKDFLYQRKADFNKTMTFIEQFSTLQNCFSVELQLTLESNFMMNVGIYDTLQQVKNESQHEILKIQLENENSDDLYKQQQLNERASKIVAMIDNVKRTEVYATQFFELPKQKGSTLKVIHDKAKSTSGFGGKHGKHDRILEQLRDSQNEGLGDKQMPLDNNTRYKLEQNEGLGDKQMALDYNIRYKLEGNIRPELKQEELLQKEQPVQQEHPEGQQYTTGIQIRSEVLPLQQESVLPAQKNNNTQQELPHFQQDQQKPQFISERPPPNQFSIQTTSNFNPQTSQISGTMNQITTTSTSPQLVSVQQENDGKQIRKQWMLPQNETQNQQQGTQFQPELVKQQVMLPHSASSVQLAQPPRNGNQNQIPQQYPEEQLKFYSQIPQQQTRTPQDENEGPGASSLQRSLSQSQKLQSKIPQRNIRQEIEKVLAEKNRRKSLQQTDFFDLKESCLTNWEPSQPQKEIESSNNYYKPNTSGMNESYITRNNVNVFIEKERLQKKGNDIVVVRNVAINKVKSGNQNQAMEGMQRKGSKIIQINKSSAIGGTSMKNSAVSRGGASSQKQLYKPLSGNQDQQYEQQQALLQQPDLKYFHNMSGINCNPNADNGNSNLENSFLSNSNILLNDQFLVENYHISRMHNCEANHEHPKFKTPKKYMNVESHYGRQNLQQYLNKDCRSFSNNQKWVKEKIEIVKTNNAGKRTFWPKNPSSEVRSKTKDLQIEQKLASHAKNFEQDMIDIKKSLALYKTSNDKLYKSTVQIPAITGESKVKDSSHQFHIQYQVDDQKGDDQNYKSLQLNHIFDKYLHKQNDGSISDRSQYSSVFQQPHQLDSGKSIQYHDRNVKGDIGRSTPHSQKSTIPIQNIQSQNDSNDKIPYTTLGVNNQASAFYHPNWVQINSQNGNTLVETSKFAEEQPVNRIASNGSNNQNNVQNGRSDQTDSRQPKQLSTLEARKKQFYQSIQDKEVQSQNDSYYLQYPQQLQTNDQKDKQDHESRDPANPKQKRDNPQDYRQMQGQQLPENQNYNGQQSSDLNLLRKDLLR